MARKRKPPPGLWDRSGVYYARFRAHERPVCKKLLRDYRATCEMLNELRARADRADFGLVDNDYPWKELKREFLRWTKQQNRVARDYDISLRWLEDYCPVKSIRQVTHQYVIGFRQWRLEHGIAPGTVNKNVAALLSMLGKAVEWQYIGANPIAGLKRLPVDKPVKDRRPLTVEEAEAVFEHSPADILPVWWTFMTTDIRHVELVEMLFSDVDFDLREGTVRRRTAKSHKARTVPLCDEVYNYIVELRERAKDRQPDKASSAKQTAQQLANFSRDHVFVGKANTPLKNGLLRRFYRICQRAGIEDACRNGSVDIHSLRMTYTTMAIGNGADPKSVQDILGHSTLALTMNTYAKATNSGKRHATAAIPFATMSGSEHVIPRQKVCAARATNSVAT